MISPTWPTHWPRNAFNLGLSILLVLGILVVGTFVLIATLIAVDLIHPQIGILIKTHSAQVLPYEVIIQGVAELFVVALVWLALPRLSGLSLRELGFRVPTVKTLGIACAGAIIAFLASGIIGVGVDAFSRGKHEQDIVKMFLQLHNPNQRAIFAAFAIVVGPLAEETVFRLFVFNFGLRYFGFTAAAICSAVLFASAHMDLYATLPLTAAGIVFAWVYYRSRNAFASMIAHSLFNTFSFIILLIAPKLAG